MSGIFGQILGALEGQQETHTNAITDILQQVVAQNGGGVAALLISVRTGRLRRSSPIMGE